jgi:hypothetical protein
MITPWPTQHRVQVDRFTSDGITDIFHLTHQPVQAHTLIIDGKRKRVGVAGKQFFFQGFDALVDQQASALIFVISPVKAVMQNNIEIVYTYDPTIAVSALPMPSNQPSPGQSLYAMYPTGHGTPAQGQGPKELIKRRKVPGWEEWDYLDYADFVNAIKADQPISYALCQWLMRQSHGQPGDAFTENEWYEWYEYALEHCPRFAREQPK